MRPHAIPKQNGTLHANVAVKNQWNGMVEWNGGVEWWNGKYLNALTNRQVYILVSLKLII